MPACYESSEQQARWVSTKWASNMVKETFQSTIEVTSQNRSGFLADLSVLLNTLRITVNAFIAREQKDGSLSFQVTVTINDLAQLDFVIAQIKKIPDVIRVQRTNG